MLRATAKQSLPTTITRSLPRPSASRRIRTWLCWPSTRS